jgi:hypothetical protein
MEKRKGKKPVKEETKVAPIICIRCKKEFKFTLTGEQYERVYHGKEYIQNILPHFRPEDREMFISHICPECWNKMMPPEEPEEDEKHMKLPEGLGRLELEDEPARLKEEEARVAPKETMAPQNLMNSVLYWCPELRNVLKLSIIAGGFIRAYYAGEKPNDLDLYFRSEVDFERVYEELNSQGWENQFETERAISLVKDGKLVQLIRVMYGTPAEVLDCFDYTVCTVALTMCVEEDKTPFIEPTNFNKDKDKEEEDKIIGTVLMHSDFFEHLASRRLVFKGSEFPLSSLKRAFKYHNRGYHLCDEELIKLAESIANSIDFEDPEDVAEHIDGMDPEGRGIRAID